ncbi:pimeloyl-ACP methyl ester carboxylesterase [Streptomyces sp. SAI-163]|uniref:alpha/beta fold hydrolase n=1 Tax=Streptomyces sp. SAI-163 TaxID=3377735 RepID=UPI003C7DA00F
MEKTTVSRDGTRIAYARSGRGPAVVLVSGAMSTGATTAPLAAELSDRFDVTVYDRRGRGESGDTAPYAVEREIEDLAALIEAVGGEASLYGMSSGGALVLRAAASGLPVRRVAVYEVPYAMDDAAARAAAEYTERLTEVLGQGRRGDAVELFLRHTGLGEEMIRGARQSPMWAGMESLASSLAYDDAVLGGQPGALLGDRRDQRPPAGPRGRRERPLVARGRPRDRGRRPGGHLRHRGPADPHGGAGRPGAGAGGVPRRVSRRAAQAAPAVARVVDAIVAEPTTRVPS